MLIWAVSLICLIVTMGFFVTVLIISQKQALETLTKLQENQSEQTSQQINRLITLLGTKDPLAYQAVMSVDQAQPDSDPVVLYSDEAEAARYQEAVEAGGFTGYGYPE